LLDSLLGDATEIVQSVANEVAPGVVGAIDVDKIIQRIDVQALLDRVDLDQLIDRIDWNKVMARVDVNALLQRVDIDTLVEQTELGTIMTRSTSALMSRSVDVVRSQGVGLDSFLHGLVDRLFRRDGRASIHTDSPTVGSRLASRDATT
jgi:hypothetical protein